MLALMCYFKCKNLPGELLPAPPATPSCDAVREMFTNGGLGEEEGEKKQKQRACLSSTVIRWRLAG